MLVSSMCGGSGKSLRSDVQGGFLANLHLGDALVPACIKLVLAHVKSSRHVEALWVHASRYLLTLDDLANANASDEVATANRAVEPVAMRGLCQS